MHSGMMSNQGIQWCVMHYWWCRRCFQRSIWWLRYRREFRVLQRFYPSPWLHKQSLTANRAPTGPVEPNSRWTNSLRTGLKTTKSHQKSPTLHNYNKSPYEYCFLKFSIWLEIYKTFNTYSLKLQENYYISYFFKGYNFVLKIYQQNIYYNITT